MATKADVERIRRALGALSNAARQDFLRAWVTIDPTDWVAARRVLEGFWPELIRHYGDMAAVLGADEFVLQAADLGVRGGPEMVRGVDAERANARMRWALGQTSQLGSLLVVLDELVKQPYRSTLQRSAASAGAGWARVPSGAETCAWCLMLASRGAVYESRATAGGEGRKYHGDCDCIPVLSRGDDDLPYDVGLLYGKYRDAREVAGGSVKNILAELRAQQGIN